MIRRQLINFQNRSVDVRVGFDAFSELSRMFASVVGRPKRAMVVWNSVLSDRFGEVVEHALIDAGFAVSQLSLEVSPAGATLADADAVFGALSTNGITCDDLIVAVGDAPMCSVVAWCANQWCGRTECALLPTTFDAMLTAATTMEPLVSSAAGTLPAIALRPEPGLVVCNLDLVREAKSEQLKRGYAILVGTMLSSSKSRWNQFAETVPEILAGEEVALVNAVQWSQTARKDVLMATNPSARHALEFGKTGERTLCACLGDAAAHVPAYQLLSEGMRFEARLATSISTTYLKSTTVWKILVSRSLLSIWSPLRLSRSSANSSLPAQTAVCSRCPRRSALFA
jgi:3-dehydroquinate synthetase